MSDKILGAALGAGLSLAAGCENRPVTPEEFAVVEEVYQTGETEILPILDKLLSLADNNVVYGYDGRPGNEAAREDLDISYARLTNAIKKKQIKAYYDEDDAEGAMKYESKTTDIGEVIAINEAFVQFVTPADWTFNRYHSSDVDGTTRQPVKFGFLLHEAAHDKDAYHHEAVTEAINQLNDGTISAEEYQRVLIEEHDFPYLLSMTSEMPERTLAESEAIGRECEKILNENTESSIIEHVDDIFSLDPNASLDRVFGFYMDFTQGRYKSIESWADYQVSNSSFMTDALKIPKDQLTQVYIESGWYEKNLEECAEAFREIDEKYRESQQERQRETRAEGRPRDIKLR